MAVLDEIVVVLLFVLFLSPNASGRKVGASTPRFFSVGAIAPPLEGWHLRRTPCSIEGLGGLLVALCWAVELVVLCHTSDQCYLDSP